MKKAWLPLLFIPMIGLSPVTGEKLATADAAKPQVGTISWYGRGFHGRRTANGERYNMHEMTCASRHLPFGTLLEITNLDNGQKAIVRVNDRGPFVRSRILDVSFGAAKELGFIHRGYVRAEFRVLPDNWKILREQERLFAESGISGKFIDQMGDLADESADSCKRGKYKKSPVCRGIVISQDSR